MPPLRSRTESPLAREVGQVSSTVWRFHRILSIGRLFVGVTGAPWKAQYLRRSDTVRTYKPGAKNAARSGPSIAVKIPVLPFEIVFGYWKTYVANVFADTPGVRAMSVQAPGEVSDEAVPMKEYRQEKAAHPPTFVARPDALSSVKHWPNA